MSGIVFALGGGAKISNRGTSNKGFIRSGQNSASVEITLRNEGNNSVFKWQLSSIFAKNIGKFTYYIITNTLPIY